MKMHGMKLARIDLNLLPLFDAIIATESVGKAAALVGLSKPAASHALSRLIYRKVSDADPFSTESTRPRAIGGDGPRQI